MTLPPYRMIVREVRRRIEAGELRPGDRVPSARAITREFGVAIATATKVHAALREEGLTISRPGVGTVVAGPAPRRDHELSRDRIVTAAIEIADTDGLAELTMRRLAATLGVSTMSLYRHVPGRDELLLAMIDTATGELALPPRHSGRWRGDLERAARLMWVVFQRHPWLAGSLSLTRPQPLPNPAMLSEWTMSALDRTRLCLQDKMFVQILLFTFVRGVASGLEPEAEAVRETGLTNDQWMETQLATFDAVLQAHPMPHFRALVDEDFDFTLDRLFEFGLARLLDGLTPWIAAHS